MHIHKTYSRPGDCYFFDTTSTPAVEYLTEIHRLLTHSFRVANFNGFQFHGYPLGRHRTNGNIHVVMCLLYPPTCCLVENHLDITPTLDIDHQLISNLHQSYDAEVLPRTPLLSPLLSQILLSILDFSHK